MSDTNNDTSGLSDKDLEDMLDKILGEVFGDKEEKDA